MKKQYTSGRTLSLWYKLKNKWTSIYNSLKSSPTINTFAKVNKLNYLSMRLGISKKIAIASFCGVMSLGAQAQMNFVEPENEDCVITTYDVGYNSNPTFVDLDGDNDLDMVSGEYNGTFMYYENSGGEFHAGMFNPLHGLKADTYSSPTFVDLDGDNDLDMVSGENYGAFRYYENNEGVFTEQKNEDNPFSSFNLGEYSAPNPTFADLDGDNDFDMICGESYGTFKYYENIEGTFVEKEGEDNPFDGFDAGSFSTPTFVDLDGDNDLDMFSGECHGTFKYYENNEGVFTEKTGTENPLDGRDVGGFSSPSFIDLDGDNDLDLVSGELMGTFKEYHNNARLITDLQFTETASTDNVYPNPATTDLFVQAEGAFTIIDALGTVAHEGELTNGNIDISSLTEGYYVIKTAGITAPFIKE